MEVIDKVKAEPTERRKIRRLLIELEKLGVIDGHDEGKNVIECNNYRLTFDTEGKISKAKELCESNYQYKYMVGLLRAKWDIDIDIMIADSWDNGLPVRNIAEKLGLPLSVVTSRCNVLRKYGFIRRRTGAGK